MKKVVIKQITILLKKAIEDNDVQKLYKVLSVLKDDGKYAQDTLSSRYTYVPPVTMSAKIRIRIQTQIEKIKNTALFHYPIVKYYSYKSSKSKNRLGDEKQESIQRGRK